MLRLGTTHWVSDKFPDEYVDFFRNQCWPHQLTVLGNGADYDIPLKTRLKGWHSKLEWFAPWNAEARPAVVLDLDTYIIGQIAPLLQIDGSKLWMIKEFLGQPEKRKAESGIFVAPDDEALCAQIWEAAQNWVGPDGHLLRQFPHQLIPDVVDGILSYKGDQLYDKFPRDARIVCFHGKPKPNETSGWAQEWYDHFKVSQTKNF